MQDRLLLQRSLASGSQPFAGEGMDPAAAMSKCLPVKPLLDERQVCAYAFDVSAVFDLMMVGACEGNSFLIL